jgi:hypothetical protein
VTEYSYLLYENKIRQLIHEGEEFVNETLRERFRNSQAVMSRGKSITEKEG